MFFQVNDAKGGGRLVSLHPIIGLGDLGYCSFLADSLGQRRAKFLQVRRHIWHFFEETRPGRWWMEALEPASIDWCFDYSFKTLAHMQEKSTNLRAMLEADPNWGSERNEGAADLQARRILGAAYLGEFERARRWLEAARRYWRSEAQERGDPCARPFERLDLCAAALVRLDAAMSGG